MFSDSHWITFLSMHKWGPNKIKVHVDKFWSFYGKLSMPWIKHYLILEIWNLLFFSMRKSKKNPQKNCSKPNELVEFDIIIHNVQTFPFCCPYAKGNYFLCPFTKLPLEVWNSIDQWKLQRGNAQSNAHAI